jgi:hypothetical protein
MELLREGMKLLYSAQDYDTADQVFFRVGRAGDNWEIVSNSGQGDTPLVVTPEAIEDAHSLLSFCQGGVSTPEAPGQDLEQPLRRHTPFLLGRSMMAELKNAGRSKLLTLAGEEELAIAERRTIRVRVDGAMEKTPVLVLRGGIDRHELIVVDDDAVPFVLAHRWGGDCFFEMRGAGDRLEVPNPDDEEPEDLSEFSTWEDVSAPAAEASEAQVSLFGKAIGLVRTQWGEMEPALALVEGALATTHKGDPVAKKLLAVLKSGGGLGDCFVGSGGLSEVALAWARQSGLPLLVPLLSLPGAPPDADRRPHNNCWIAAANGKHVWTIGQTGWTWWAKHWNTESGIPDQEVRFPRGHHPRNDNSPKAWRVLPDGNLEILTEQHQFLVLGPSSAKPLSKVDLYAVARRQAEAEGIEVTDPYGLQITVEGVQKDSTRCACDLWISNAKTQSQEHRMLIVSLPSGKIVSVLGPEKIDAEGWALDSELQGYHFGETDRHRGPHELRKIAEHGELWEVVEVESGASLGVVAVPRRGLGNDFLPIFAVTSDGAMVLGTDANDPSDTLVYRRLE